MGERAVDAVLDSKRDDDLESSLVLAVAVVMVGTVLVGDGREDMVELLDTALRWMSAEEREAARDVSLGKNEVNSPRRGLCLADPIVSAGFSAGLFVMRLSSFQRRHSSREGFQVSVVWFFFFLGGWVKSLQADLLRFAFPPLPLLLALSRWRRPDPRSLSQQQRSSQ